MRTQHLIASLVCLLSAGIQPSPGETSRRFVEANDPRFQYLGAWADSAEGRYTIYPGSQIRFGLKGKTHLALQSGIPDSLRIMVRRNDEIVLDLPLEQGGLELDGGEAGAAFSIVYLASREKGFDPAQPGAKGAELHFQGIQLDENSVLDSSSALKSETLHEFIGDSITAGASLFGRSGLWDVDSDASKAYAFRLAEKLMTRYRIRATRGDNIGGMAREYPFFRKGIPISAEQAPDFVWVNIGANDRSKNTAQYRTGMRNLLDVIFTTYPATHIVLLNFHRMTPNRLPTLQALADSYPEGRVTCFDARPYLVGYSDGGVHPDAESHRRLADALASYVKQYLLQESTGIGVGSKEAADGRIGHE